MTFIHEPRNAVVVVDHEDDYFDRSLPTASWWDKYRLIPGRYPLEPRNVGGTPWNPNPDVPAPGFLSNIGPDHYVAHVNAVLVESYRENRLLHHVKAQRKHHEERTTLPVRLYTWEVQNGQIALDDRAGAYVELIEE